MRLWKRTVLLMLTTLFLSLTLVGGLTIYITGKNRIETLAASYWRQLALAAGTWNQFWDNTKYEQMTEIGRNSYLGFQFDMCCGRGFVLLNEGEQVVRNETEYEILSIEALEGISDTSASDPDYRIQKLEDSYLLLQILNLELPQDHRLLSVRDITGDFQEIGELALWFLGIYTIIFLSAGIFIYWMMRRTVLCMEQLQDTAEKQELLLGALAHEMKTPLTSIIGFSDSLLHVKLDERQQMRALEHVNREGRRLETLSGKLLQLVGLYQNEAISMQEHEIGELIGRVAELEGSACERAGIRLMTEWEDFTVHMDLELMESLLINLVDNARRASEQGDVIRICAWNREGQKMLQVMDEGHGIPEEELQRVTEAFYMVDKSRSRKAGGSGLGLALCSLIADRHRAELLIESTVGRGTCVSVMFPWR